MNGEIENLKLYGTDKKLVSFKDLIGKPIFLYFFPAAFTDVCTDHLCKINEFIAYFNKYNILSFGISTDSIFSLIELKKKNSLQFELLSDINKAAIAAFDVIEEEFAFDMKNVAKRSVFIFNKEGQQIYSEVMKNPGQTPDFDSAKKIIAEL